MSKKEIEISVKEAINIIQNSNDEFEKQDAMMFVLDMFVPFRRSLTSKFAGKGVDFDDVCQVIDLKLIEAMYDYDEMLDESAIRHITSRARNGIFNFYKKEMNYFKEDRKTVSIEILSNKNEQSLSFSIQEYEILGAIGLDEFNENKVIERIMIEEGLKSLTSHQKDLIFMYYMSDMTQEEIADELKIHQANVSRATKRGVKKLKESFNPLDEHDDML